MVDRCSQDRTKSCSAPPSSVHVPSCTSTVPPLVCPGVCFLCHTQPQTQAAVAAVHSGSFGCRRCGAVGPPSIHPPHPPVPPVSHRSHPEWSDALTARAVFSRTRIGASLASRLGRRRRRRGRVTSRAFIRYQPELSSSSLCSHQGKGSSWGPG